MDKLTSIRIKYSDGTYLDEVPIGVLAQNVGYDSGHNLIQVLGSVDVESDGTIQQQINRLFNEKLNTSDLSSYVNSKITTDVSKWLADNVNPVGSAVIVDQSLSISGAAADASVTGEELDKLHNSVDSILSGDFGTSGIEFEKGGIEGGNNATYRKACRLRTKEIAILPYDLTVKIISNNTRVDIYKYENGEYVGGTGSYISITELNSSYTIPANTEFRFYLDGRNSLSTSELTVEELLSKIELTVDLLGLKQITNAISILNSNIDAIPDYGEEIDKLHNSVDSIQSGDFGIDGIEFEKGGMEAGSNTTYRKDCRLRTKEIVILPYDLTVKIISANTHMRIYSYEDSVYVQTLSYMTQNGESYTIPANTEFRFYLDGRDGLATSELTVEELLSKIELIIGLLGLKQITNAISILNSNIDMIPDYYFENDYLQNKARTAQLASGVKGISFGFITDIHTGDNARNSMKLAKYIADKTTALPFIICGGDIPETNTGSEDGLYEQAQYWQEMMAQYGKHNVYQCRGNHDYLTKLSGNASFNASNGVCFSYVMGNQPYGIHPSAKGKMSYYFDVDTAKIRFVILDEYDVSNPNPDADFSSYVGLSPAQYHWFVDEALKIDGYDIVIIVHQPLNIVDDPSYISNLDLLRDIIAAFNAHEQFSGSWGATTINVDFSTYTSNLICVLSGHKHIDTSSTVQFLSIVTTSDALYTSDGYGRQAGTVSEGAFDIVSIDTSNRIINCTRIGGGYDRQFTY